MKNINLNKAAALLGVAEESLENFPDDKINELISVMEMYEINTAEDAENVYHELYPIWLSVVTSND